MKWGGAKKRRMHPKQKRHNPTNSTGLGILVKDVQPSASLFRDTSDSRHKAPRSPPPNGFSDFPFCPSPSPCRAEHQPSALNCELLDSQPQLPAEFIIKDETPSSFATCSPKNRFPVFPFCESMRNFSSPKICPSSTPNNASLNARLQSDASKQHQVRQVLSGLFH